jgi:hypothetical protein
MIHQDTPHQLRRYGKKMGTALPLHAPVVDQPGIRLVNQRGRLQRVASAFVAHIAAGEAPQFVINNGSEAVQRLVVSVAPREQERADFIRIRDPVMRRYPQRLFHTMITRENIFSLDDPCGFDSSPFEST